MRKLFFLAGLMLAGLFCVNAQDTGLKADAASGENADASASIPSLTKQVYQRPDAEKRFKRFVNNIFGPVALARTFGSSGIQSWRKSPAEWGDNWSGFGRRLGSEFGKSAIRNTTVYALDEALTVDSSFYLSKRKDAGAKFRNALLSPVTARKPNGKRVIGIPRITGVLVSNVVAYETWYPARFGYRDGLRATAISFGVSAGVNLFREFVIKR